MWRLYLIAIFFLFSPFAMAVQEPVQVGISAELPPPLFFDSGTELSGLVPDYSMAIVESLGRKGAFMVLPRNRLFQYLETGRVDILCYMSKEWAEDQSSFLWADPLFLKREVILGPSPMPRNPTDLKGKTLGTMVGYLYPKLDEHFKNKTIYREDAANAELTLNKLLNRHLDYAISDELYLDHYKKHHQDIDKGRERLLLQQYPVSCAVSKVGSVTTKELNSAIRKLKESKKLESIFKKYGVTLYPL